MSQNSAAETGDSHNLETDYDAIYQMRPKLIALVMSRHNLDYQWASEMIDSAIEIAFQKNFQSFPADKSLRPIISFILTATANLHKNWLRRSETNLLSLTDDDGEPLPIVDAGIPSVEHRVAQKIKLEEVIRQLNSLRVRDRKLLLRRMSGYTYSEMAPEFNMSENATRQATRRALNKLKVLVRDEEADKSSK